MARVLGYGGLANTNGARSYAGKTLAPIQHSSRLLGYGGLGNSNGLRSFAGKEEAGASTDTAYRFRSNEFNRRRYGGLWAVILFLLLG